MADESLTKLARDRKGDASRPRDLAVAFDNLREMVQKYKDFLRSRYPGMRSDNDFPPPKKSSSQLFASKFAIVKEMIEDQIQWDRLPAERTDTEFYWVRPMVENSTWVLAAKAENSWRICLSCDYGIFQRQDENGELWDSVGFGIDRFQYEIGPRVLPPA